MLLMNSSCSTNILVGEWVTSSGYTNHGPWNHGSPLGGGGKNLVVWNPKYLMDTYLASVHIRSILAMKGFF